MAKIKRFFECLVPVSVCNLECPYCYIIQEDRRKMALADMPYSPEHIARALRPERVGGTCFISICGAGETLAQKEVVPIVGELLKEGHFVNITTNGTLSRRFDELIEACGENIGHLHLSFSMHYTELLRKGWVETFFDNIRKMRDAGASILLQLNLCDEYVPYIEEIQRLSMEKVGARPSFCPTSRWMRVSSGRRSTPPAIRWAASAPCLMKRSACSLSCISKPHIGKADSENRCRLCLSIAHTELQLGSI